MSMSAGPRFASGEASPGSSRIGRRLTYCWKSLPQRQQQIPDGNVIGNGRRADGAEIDGVERRQPLEAVGVHHPAVA